MLVAGGGQQIKTMDFVRCNLLIIIQGSWSFEFSGRRFCWFSVARTKIMSKKYDFVLNNTKALIVLELYFEINLTFQYSKTIEQVFHQRTEKKWC